jgi:hypothetical protein
MKALYVRGYGVVLLALLITSPIGSIAFPTQPLSQSSSPKCVPPPSGLMSWWPGDGNANDIVGTNKGSLQNGATFAPGLVGQAFSLNEPGPVPFFCASCAYVSIANNFPSAVNEVTIEAWVYPTGSPENQWVYTQYPTGPQLGFGGTDQSGLIFWRPNGDSPFFFNIPGSIPLNRWSHLAGTYSATTRLSHLYVNGNLVGSASSSGPVSLTATPFIGKRLQQEFFVGLVDEVSIYSRALSGLEIRNIFNAGSAGKCKCQLSIDPKWSQSDAPWGDTLYDFCQAGPVPCMPLGHDFMKQQGCATTALAVALHQAGVTTDPISGTPVFDPGLLNAFMEFGSSAVTGTAGDYVGHAVNFEMTTLDVSRATILARGGKALYFDDSFRNDSSLSDLKDLVCKGRPVIVAVAPVKNCVPLAGLPGGHYVIVTGEKDDAIGNHHFDIVDPGCAHGVGSGAITSLDSYNNNFEIRGFISDPTDVSTLEVATDNNADVLVTDSAGSTTGFDPATQLAREEIPRSSYGRDFITDNDTGQQSTGTQHSINLFHPNQGVYHIVVTGLRLGIYELFVGAFATDGTPQPRYSAAGIAGPGSTRFLTIEYTSSPSGATNVVLVATFQSTFDEVSNSLQLGLIDNHGIANSLSQKIQAANNASGPARANILNAFKNEVNAQCGKHVTALAAQVLSGDADSLISQTQ